MVTGCALNQQRFLNDPKKGGNNQKEKKARKEQKQSSDINISLRGSNHANLIQPNLRPHQLGIAQIITFNTHIERYIDTGIALSRYAAAITK